MDPRPHYLVHRHKLWLGRRRWLLRQALALPQAVVVQCPVKRCACKQQQQPQRSQQSKVANIWPSIRSLLINSPQKTWLPSCNKDSNNSTSSNSRDGRTAAATEPYSRDAGQELCMDISTPIHTAAPSPCLPLASLRSCRHLQQQNACSSKPHAAYRQLTFPSKQPQTDAGGSNTESQLEFLLLLLVLPSLLLPSHRSTRVHKARPSVCSHSSNSNSTTSSHRGRNSNRNSISSSSSSRRGYLQMLEREYRFVHT